MAFDFFDKDKSGYIDKVRVRARARARARARVRIRVRVRLTLTLILTLTLTQSELKLVLGSLGTVLSEDDLALLYVEMDPSGDGQIDLGEFTSVMAQDPANKPSAPRAPTPSTAPLGNDAPLDPGAR